jgi:hypothetical protein
MGWNGSAASCMSSSSSKPRLWPTRPWAVQACSKKASDQWCGDQPCSRLAISRVSPCHGLAGETAGRWSIAAVLITALDCSPITVGDEESLHSGCGAPVAGADMPSRAGPLGSARTPIWLRGYVPPHGSGCRCTARPAMSSQYGYSLCKPNR